MEIIDLKQGSPEWRSFRKTKIGASDSNIIMGVCPWSTPYQLWRRKIGLDSEQDINFHMQRGIELEPQARDFFNKMLNAEFIPAVYQSTENPWMIASLDGISNNDIIEIKCPSRNDHSLALEGKIPRKYIPQLMHQMSVCNVEKMYYGSFDGEIGVALEIERDDTYIKNLIQFDKEFYQCMIEMEAPELTERDYLDMDNNEEWIQHCRVYKRAKRFIETFQEEMQQAKQAMLELCGEKNSKGSGITLSKVISKGRIDYNEIPELKGVNLEKYRKPITESWRISVK